MNVSIRGVLPDDSDTGKAAQQNLYLPIGGSLNVALSVLTSGGGVVDLTGYTLRLTVKSVFSAPAILTKMATVATPTSGTATFAFVPADTALLIPQKLAYDVQLIGPSSRDQIVPISGFVLTSSVGLPSDP